MPTKQAKIYNSTNAKPLGISSSGFFRIYPADDAWTNWGNLVLLWVVDITNTDKYATTDKEYRASSLPRGVRGCAGSRSFPQTRCVGDDRR